MSNRVIKRKQKRSTCGRLRIKKERKGKEMKRLWMIAVKKKKSDGIKNRENKKSAGE